MPNEQEVRKIVAEVVAYLLEKGYLQPSPGAASRSPSPLAGGGRQVTMGTAGKVFAGELVSKRPPANEKEEEDHTHSSSCPQCQCVGKLSHSDLSALGADRIAVCQPAESCSSVARLVDHTLLKPHATQEEVAKLCEEAKRFCFASVCINPAYVPLASKLLKGSGVKVCTVVGFPLGSTTPTVKAIEARDAMANGAEEIDMVINVGALKSGNDALVLEDIRSVREATRGRILKVILETAYLTRDEKIRACALAKQAGADFVKTSTGFGPGGATVEDIRLMREAVGPSMGVKASGGIRDEATAQAMIEAGATRLGTSASVAIVTGHKSEAKY